MPPSDSSQKSWAMVPYTEQEKEDLQSLLDGMLGPEYVNYRPAPGGSSVAYLKGDVAINLANEIFGFNGWSSEIKEVTLDECSESHGKWSAVASVHLRITLKDGTFREDIGTGDSSNQKTKGTAILGAKKQAVTDALKRTFRTFGNALGNCLYDKQHIKGTRRMKATQPVQEPSYYRPRSLRERDRIKQEESLVIPNRPGDILQARPEKIVSENDLAEGFDEYGGDEYDDLGAFGDGDSYSELVADEDLVEAAGDAFKRPTPPTPTGAGAVSTVARRGINQSMITPDNQSAQVSGPRQDQQRRVSPNLQPQAQQTRSYPQPQNRGLQQQPQNVAAGQRPPLQKPTSAPQGPRTPAPNAQMASRAGSVSNNTHNLRNVQQQQQQQAPKASPSPPHDNPQSVPVLPAPYLNGQPETPINPPSNAPIGFYTGRVMLNPQNEQKVLQGENRVIPADHAFNPHKETTIPRSAGIDHSKSSPISRKIIQSTNGAGSPFARRNFENPSMNPNRQIGTPVRGAGAFRQPTPAVGGIKRPADINGPGSTRRPTLGNSSETNLNAQTSNFGNDPKRVKS